MQVLLSIKIWHFFCPGSTKTPVLIMFLLIQVVFLIPNLGHNSDYFSGQMRTFWVSVWVCQNSSFTMHCLFYLPCVSDHWDDMTSFALPWYVRFALFLEQFDCDCNVSGLLIVCIRAVLHLSGVCHLRFHIIETFAPLRSSLSSIFGCLSTCQYPVPLHLNMRPSKVLSWCLEFNVIKRKILYRAE